MMERKTKIALVLTCAIFLLFGLGFGLFYEPKSAAPEETPEAAAISPAPEDAVWAADVGLDLIRDSHPAYLFPDEAGRCRPGQSMSCGEAAQMFCALLPGEPEGEAAPETAISALAALDLLEAESFDADSPLTLLGLLELLSHFYPPASETARFSDLSEGDEAYALCCLAAERGWIDSGETVPAASRRVLTRLETARIMNAVLGRGEDPGDCADAAAALCDLPEDEEDRLTMLEAAVTHEYSAARWTSAEAPLTLIPGFSSGDWALDRQLAAILDEQLAGETERDEQLRLLYRYVRDNYQYRKGEQYDMGDGSWLCAEAKKLALTGRGNCYSYAALLGELYRAIGIDAEVYSGKISDSPHAWVEAELDGVRYIFDVEMEYSYRRQGRRADMFMKTYEEMTRWKYERG